MSAPTPGPGRRLRSRDWFDNPDRMDMTALYLERLMNYGVTPEELRSGNLFDFAIMKTSVIGEEFRARYLSRPGAEGVF